MIAPQRRSLVSILSIYLVAPQNADNMQSLSNSTFEITIAAGYSSVVLTTKGTHDFLKNTLIKRVCVIRWYSLGVLFLTKTWFHYRTRRKDFPESFVSPSTHLGELGLFWGLLRQLLFLLQMEPKQKVAQTASSHQPVFHFGFQRLRLHGH